MALIERLRAFLRERYQFGGLAELATHKTVPLHRHSVWYYWGGMTLVLIGIQLASGLLLLLYYRPSAQEAFESIRFIMTKVEFGWLIRSVHAWAANLVILCAMVHLASTFFLKAYRPPRELTWVTGVLLFFLLLGFGFTGYLLPWNTLAFFATKVGTEIAGVVPVVGPVMQMILRGGSDVGDVTLTRFFWFHIAVLPAGLLALLAVHLVMIQLQGMSKPLSVTDDRSRPFFPNFLLRDVVAWHEGGSLRADAGRDPARVVLPLDVPDAEAVSGSCVRHRGRVDRGGAHRGGRCRARAGAVAGPARPEGQGLVGGVGGRDRRSLVYPRDDRVRRMGDTARALTRLSLMASLALAPGLARAEPPSNSCVECHRQMEGEARGPAALFANDIHAQRGLSC
ncbi:MAG: cytochrome b N-terminal domain-containing protein, partial [Candidatus Omnitrophica bacterium]|nr:cytochrome b N-terminal domain-containing protein [Candidatus Omnitrophota bacterium]